MPHPGPDAPDLPRAGQSQFGAGQVAPEATGPAAPTGDDLPMADATSWRHWWDHNKEPFLVPAPRGAVTGDAEFFLGQGAERRTDAAIEAGLEPEVIERRVLPLLSGFLDAEQDARTQAEAALAYARAAASLPVLSPGTSDPLIALLDHGNGSVGQAATVALGVLGDARGVDLLERLVRCRTKPLREEYALDFGAHVSTRQRAFAAYALGLLGARGEGYTRTRIANALAVSLFDEQHRRHSPEVQAACAAALGLVPLPVRSSEPRLEGRRLEGQRELPSALLSRRDQVRWLLCMFDSSELGDRARAQIASSLARLVEDTEPEFGGREVVAERLVRALAHRSGEGHFVRRAAVTALGFVGDADDDELDVEVRRALARTADEASDQLTRRLALMALARVAVRPGSAVDRWHGTAAVRELLLDELKGGNSLSRPWAALALGTLERGLAERHLPTAESTLRALRKAFERTRSPHERGAVALALGLARDSSASGLLVKALANGGDAELRADLALALGMIGSVDVARPALRKVFREASLQERLHVAAARGLHLLGDRSVVPTVAARVARNPAQREALLLLDALEQVRSPLALNDLLELADRDDVTQGSRAAALAALGASVEQSTLPWDAPLAVGCAYLSGLDSLTSVPRGGGVLGLD